MGKHCHDDDLADMHNAFRLVTKTGRMCMQPISMRSCLGPPGTMLLVPCCGTPGTRLLRSKGPTR